jgi:hypothetical protein
VELFSGDAFGRRLHEDQLGCRRLQRDEALKLAGGETRDALNHSDRDGRLRASRACESSGESR